MNNDLSLQLFAFDCNGITAEQHDNAIAAIKKFGKALRKTGRQQNVSGILFTKDKDIKVVNVPLNKYTVDAITLSNDGTGTCAMLDRCSDLMYKVGVRLNDTPEEERPSQVIMTIIVFGRDNASTQCTYEQLREMIAHQRDVYKWKFYLMTDYTINMEKLGIAEDDTILIKKREKNWFKRPFAELTDKLVAYLPQ